MVEPFLAFRFVHPQFDSREAVTGLVVNNSRHIDTVEGSVSIRQAVLLLLTTRPGERVMRPEYGCHLHRLMFAPNDATTAGLAIHYVRRAIDLWEPRIDILRLDAGPASADRGRLDVALDYRVRSSQQQESMIISVDLMAQES